MRVASLAFAVTVLGILAHVLAFRAGIPGLDILRTDWLIVTGLTLFLEGMAVIDARADVAAVKHLNGHARRLVVESAYRRELTRLLVAAMLMGVAVFRGPTGIVLLILVAVFLMLNSVSETRDRRILARKHLDEILAERLRLGQ